MKHLLPVLIKSMEHIFPSTTATSAREAEREREIDEHPERILIMPMDSRYLLSTSSLRSILWSRFTNRIRSALTGDM